MGCSCNCCRQEFTKQNFGLDYSEPETFGKSQWGSPSIIYLLLWRWPTFIFFVIVLVFSVINNIENASNPWPVYVTNWALSMLIMSCLFEAISATYHYTRYIKGLKYESMPVLFKISWVWYNFMNPSAFVVTLIYWTFLSKGEAVVFYNLGVHALNSVYVFINLFVSGHPTRLLHVYQAIIPPALWFIMAGVYYAVTGRVIYSLLDFGNNALSASLVGLGLTFVAMPILHAIVFGLYKLRVVMYESCARRKQVGENEAQLNVRDDPAKHKNYQTMEESDQTKQSNSNE